MTIPALNLQVLAQLSAERMLNGAAEGIGMALIAWILLRAMGGQNSGTRFAVWFSVLLAIAALPLFGTLGSSSVRLARPSGITLPASWAVYMFAAWLLIAGIGLVRVGLGLLQIHKLGKSCVPIDVNDLDPVLRNSLEEFGSSRPVTVCLSDRLRVPTAIGFMRPLVVIPAWAMKELSTGELNAILLHELAHLRRWDDCTNLAQKILAALLFFHPAVWWIENQLSLEREMACDDLVLAETTNPRAYAACLVSLAEKSCRQRGLALAQAAVKRMRHISLRVSQILDVNRPRSTRVWEPALLLLGGFSLLSPLVLSHTPRLVSFNNRAAGLAAASTVRNPMARRSSATTEISSPGARVIPARLEMSSEAKDSLSARARTIKPEHKPAIIPAKAVQRGIKPKPPVLIRSSAGQVPAIAQTVFVVLQTREFDASGFTVWNLCVWRVTVLSPVQNRIEKGIGAKSI